MASPAVLLYPNPSMLLSDQKKHLKLIGDACQAFDIVTSMTKVRMEEYTVMGVGEMLLWMTWQLPWRILMTGSAWLA